MRNQTILKFWSIPVFTVYFYAANILMQYGYISYFGIPSSFIESSVKENILYFFNLFQIIIIFIGQLKWWVALLLILPVLIIIDLCKRNSSWRNFFNILLVILFISSLWFSYKFGGKIAEVNTNYMTIDSSCIGSNTDYHYIIPDIYQGDMILVPVNKENTIVGGYIVKDSSSLDCLINNINIGAIKK